MNIEQQRSNFEDYELKKKPSASHKILFQRFEVECLGVNEREYVGQYISSDMQEKWELWLAAQQQEEVNKLQKEVDAMKAKIQELWTELDDRQSKEYIIEKCESIIQELLK